MLRRTALASFALALGLGAAAAADLPRKAPPAALPPPPPPYNWSGWYLGGFFGLGAARNDVNDTSFNIEGFQAFGTDRAFSNGVGPLGGVTLGWNWQLPNAPIVLGIEGDWAWASIKGDATRNATRTSGDFFGLDVFNASARTNWQVKDIATITGRFGLISGPQDRTLWYVKGGGAWVRTNVNVNAQFNEVACSGFFFIFDCDSDSARASFSRNVSRWGWVVGTGLEFGLWGNWTGKVEYDYISVGSRDFTFNDRPVFFGDTINTTFSTQLKQQIHEVKFGLNYRFDWGLWGKSPRTY
jgi:opacity protein-like surface antigen